MGGTQFCTQSDCGMPVPIGMSGTGNQQLACFQRLTDEQVALV